VGGAKRKKKKKGGGAHGWAGKTNREGGKTFLNFRGSGFRPAKLEKKKHHGTGGGRPPHKKPMFLGLKRKGPGPGTADWPSGGVFYGRNLGGGKKAKKPRHFGPAEGACKGARGGSTHPRWIFFARQKGAKKNQGAQNKKKTAGRTRNCLSSGQGRDFKSNRPPV